VIIPDIYDDLVIYKGLDFDQQVKLPVDLTDCVASCQIRAKQSSGSNLLATVEVTISEPVNGIVDLFLDRSVTINLPKYLGYYSLVVTASGIDSAYLIGKITFKDQPTVLV